MTASDWWLLALGVALVIVPTVLVMLWEDKRTRHRCWCAVFYRAPLSWREYLAEKKNFITARQGKTTKNDKRRKPYGQS